MPKKKTRSPLSSAKTPTPQQHSLDTGQFKLDVSMQANDKALCHSTQHTQFGRVRACHRFCWHFSGSIKWVVPSLGLCSTTHQWAYLAVGSFYDVSYSVVIPTRQSCFSFTPLACFFKINMY